MEERFNPDTPDDDANALLRHAARDDCRPSFIPEEASDKARATLRLSAFSIRRAASEAERLALLQPARRLGPARHL